MKSERISAGLLMFHLSEKDIKFFLVHPGGPLFTKKDIGYWGIPKGLLEDGEDLQQAAIREFEEETGIHPSGDLIPLGSVKQKGGKTVHAWAFRCSSDSPIEVQCNLFEMEWPPYSGKKESFPEIDKGEFFDTNTAKVKINQAQIEFIDRLVNHLNEKELL